MTDARSARTSVVVVQEAPDGDALSARASVVVVQEVAPADALSARASIVVIQHAPTPFEYGWAMLPIRS